MVVKVGLKKREYDIIIERGIFEKIAKEIKNTYSGKKIMVVTDSNVDSFYGDLIIKLLKDEGYYPCKFVFKAGEQSKNHDTLIDLYYSLAKNEIGRKDLIIAFGGGVTGDITGFAASTWQRGVRFIQVPTTLLAMVDSSVGGKTGVNTKDGKNMVGSFYQPAKVLIDPNLLKTLDSDFIKDGMGEIIKYGCIWDEKLFNKLEQFDSESIINNIEPIIQRCCEIKSEVVKNDEFDNGLRMVLNFGHTVGHAIEKCQNYKGLTHGQGVAVGMFYITKRSELFKLTKENTAKRVESMIKKYDLPYKMPEINKNEILKAIMLDKKSIGENINLVILEKIGKSMIIKYNKTELEKFLYGYNKD